MWKNNPNKPFPHKVVVVMVFVTTIVTVAKAGGDTFVSHSPYLFTGALLPSLEIL